MKKLYLLSHYIYKIFLLALLPLAAGAQSLQQDYEQALLSLDSDSSTPAQAAAYDELLSAYLKTYPAGDMAAEFAWRRIEYALNNKQSEKAFLQGLKLFHLYSEHTRASQAYRVVDSLLTYHVKWGPAADINKILSALDTYKPEPDIVISFVNFLAFLQELDYSFVNGFGAEQCRLFRDLFKEQPRHHDVVLFWQARFEEKARQYEKALLHYRLLIKTFPQSAFAAEGSMYLATLLTNHFGRGDEARNMLVEIINQNPTGQLAARAQYNLAMLYDTYLEDEKEALTQYKLYVRTFPDGEYSNTALLRMAQLSDKLGMKEDALAIYSEMVETAPDTLSIIKALTAMIDLQTNHFKAKQKAARSYVMLASFNSDEQAQVHLSRAVELYAQAGAMEQARITLNKLEEQYPSAKSIARLKELIKR